MKKNTPVVTGFVLLLIFLASSDASATSRKGQGTDETWTPAPVSILQNLPAGLGLPQGLRINALGTTNPMTVDNLTGALAPTTVLTAFSVVNGSVVPAALAVEPEPSFGGAAFDAQGPAWLQASTFATWGYTYLCPSSPGLVFYGCPSNLVSGLKINFGDSVDEQVIFLNLGTYNTPVYDSQDWSCQPNGVDFFTTQACQYHNLGTANDAWELGFNCGNSAGDCAGGAALQWRGTLYTASAAVLTATSPNFPGLPGANFALNEFVYTAGKLSAPPGWQSFTVTYTAILGVQCQFVAGSKLTFTGAVVAWGLKGVPSGNVTLYDGTTALGSATLNSLGVAKISTVLGSGSHALTMSYPGNSAYAPSQSQPDLLVSKDLYPTNAPSGCNH
jgi:hypothetical protein